MHSYKGGGGGEIKVESKYILRKKSGNIETPATKSRKTFPLNWLMQVLSSVL